MTHRIIHLLCILRQFIIIGFLIVLAISCLLIATARAGYIEIPPDDPQCKEGEKAICTQSCMSTLAYCGPSGTFENGKFIKNEARDCNTTTCVWDCSCYKVSNIEGVSK